ncbi:NAD(P)H-binding protein [Paraliomyxa miuraensis]|uniref:NAD(P)H-binding protein n=1 Tax=Paraliomyxa miuraensis TaxID=376150 RepID=UPI00225B5262|nr:NAD(P)H-binding protein [Paraliomyxa miuraensis]MCX4243252.1 NAD(P)H-binding protein [Paraliomyxa miuraensis]
MTAPAVAFVAGATGYTGRAVVDALVERGVRTVAHVRPDSPRRAEWTERWQSRGAEADATPWDEAALTRTLRTLRPTVVLALLGTTRARARREGKGAVEGYEAIDHGLTMMLLSAARACGSGPRFVYLSAAGLSEGTRNPYMRVRVRVEQALREGELPYTIARPSFITGSERDESRLGERVGAVVADGLLGLAGMLGGRTLRDRYQSMTNVELAAGLVRVALDPGFENRVAEGEDLRG